VAGSVRRRGSEMFLQRASWVGVAVALALVAGVSRGAAPSTATASATFVAASLNLQATLQLTSAGVTCPPEAPSGAIECRARTGSGSIPGLGGVSETYLWSYGVGSPPCPSSLVKPLATTGRLVVAGKGEINFALAQGARCVDVEPVRNQPQDFTITGGTGSYLGASGSGNVLRAFGFERWTGTIVVPEREFDVTPPTLSGATSKTVRAPKGAKRVRVTYKVTASDNADGQVPVTCEPRSGSRFRVGRTVVRCSATDSSANTANASFRIIVGARK
jgi:HYR domain